MGSRIVGLEATEGGIVVVKILGAHSGGGEAV